MPNVTTEPRTFTRTRFELRGRSGGDALPIRGDLRMPSGIEPATVVVICHGFKGFRSWGFFPALARALASHGHAALTFDFSHNGVGADGVDFSALELFARQTHTRNLDEIRHVVDALYAGKLLHHPPSAVGLFGHSRGGAEAVLAAAGDERVHALVTWAAVADLPSRWSPEQIAAWQRGERIEIANARTGQGMPIAPEYWADLATNRAELDVLGAARRLTIPWMIIHGEDDTSVAPTDAQQLFDAAGDETELVLLEQTDHTFGATHPFTGATPSLRTATESTVAWFDEHLGGEFLDAGPLP